MGDKVAARTIAEEKGFPVFQGSGRLSEGASALELNRAAESIGFPLASDEDPQRQLLRHLQHRHYLLVLDNFEHLLEGALILGIAAILIASRFEMVLDTILQAYAFLVAGLFVPTLECQGRQQRFCYHAASVLKSQTWCEKGLDLLKCR